MPATSPLWFPKIPSNRIRVERISTSSEMMLAIVHLLGMYIADLIKSRRRLEVENLFLRHQLNIALRRTPQRLTRLTNAFSKKVANHAHAMALHFLYYNFVRIHQTLKVTPAMAAGVTDRLWEMGDVVDLLEAFETAQKRAA
jgi:hypothetical protein